MARKSPKTVRLPLLPLKDVVFFPQMVAPLMVGRQDSVASVDESLGSERPLFLCTQRDAEEDSPGMKGLHAVGVAGSILQTMRTPENTIKVVVEGLRRARLVRVHRHDYCVEAEVQEMEDSYDLADEELQMLMRAAIDQFEDYVRISQRVSPEIIQTLRSVDYAGELADLMCAYLPVPVHERQELLELSEVRERLERVASILMRENDLLGMEKRVRDRVREQMDRGQREHFLHEQLKAIHQELGNEEGMDEAAQLRQQIEKAKMPAEVKERALRELTRYERMPPMSPESAITRTYLDWLVDVPWKKRSRDQLDIKQARAVLDEDHYGLDKVKDRILEFLAVRKLSKSTRGPVLCLVGPPGVGKTSLGKSIARAMSRKFVRLSLGGVRDEAEIRGHRRTYIGAMPGRIIQSMKRVGVKNPVFMLDEVDKMNMDFRGDPASALLEVLDPEQNRAFSDHYLEVDFDLHEVFFITTANSDYDIPEPLYDRMEVVNIPGYTAYEKRRIAEEFLIPRQMKESGLTEKDVAFESEGLETLIQRYTREAGVRELERQIASLLRKVARRVIEGAGDETVRLTPKKISELLGPEQYSDLRADAQPEVGLAIGLAWTWAGGDILNIETSIMKGKGEVILTGQLGEVMKESAQAAHTYIRAHSKELGVSERFYTSYDIHLHVPEGAIPKDGPSAGTALAVSMLSALRKQAPEPAIAMTGEITLRGRVLEIGAVKEKILAAKRAGIRTVLLPKDNEKDMADVPEEIRKGVDIQFVSGVGEVFEKSFGDLSNPAKKSASKKSASKKKPAAKRKTPARKKQSSS